MVANTGRGSVRTSTLGTSETAPDERRGSSPDRRSSRPVGVPRRVVALLIGALLTLGVVTLDAAPAQAAGTGSATVCFQVQGGIYNRPVLLDAKVNGTWYQIATLTPNTRGCIVGYRLPAGYRWRFRVYHYERGLGYYVGRSRAYTIASGYRYNYGTVVVQFIPSA